MLKKTPVLEFLFHKVADLRPATFLKKRLQQSCFPVNIAIFLRTRINEEHRCERLLLFI